MSDNITLMWGQAWPRPANNLAAAIPRIAMNYTCACDNHLNPWRNVYLVPNSLTVTFNTEVYLRSDAWYTAQKVSKAWVLRAEGDHMSDFDRWAKNTGKPLVDGIEGGLLGQSWFTRSGCGDDVGKALWGAVVPSLNAANAATIAAHDTPGRHTYGGANQRP